MDTCAQLLAGVAMVAGSYGSMLFVDTKKEAANYSLGAQVFMLGNITNIAVGLSIGDLSMVVAQAGLAFFTIPMFENRKVSLALVLMYIYMTLQLGVANHFHFTASWLGIAASATAVYGAWAMAKAKWDIMNWCWVVADLAFIYIAILNQLLGLFVLASLFVWHGYLRIKGYKRHGLFGYTK
jgi:hypothetical protein